MQKKDSISRERFKIRIDTRPCSVYRLYSAGGTLLYVGVATDAVQRVGQHRDKNWYTEITYAKFEHYKTREEALAQEAKIIDEEKPLYNGCAGKGGKTTVKQATKNRWCNAQ